MADDEHVDAKCQEGEAVETKAAWTAPVVYSIDVSTAAAGSPPPEADESNGPDESRERVTARAGASAAGRACGGPR
jgi:hypothetical protein